MKLVKAGTTEWVHGTGYRKSALASEKDLNCSGTLVQLITIEAGDKVGPHYHHEGVEAFYFIQGRGAFTINGEEVVVGPGDLLLCHPKEVHTTEAYPPESLVYVVFKTNWRVGDSTWLECRP